MSQGFKRLCLVLSVAWLTAFALFWFASSEDRFWFIGVFGLTQPLAVGPELFDLWLVILACWLGPVSLLYALVAASHWVWRGFVEEQP